IPGVRNEAAPRPDLNLDIGSFDHCLLNSSRRCHSSTDKLEYPAAPPFLVIVRILRRGIAFHRVCQTGPDGVGPSSPAHRFVGFWAGFCRVGCREIGLSDKRQLFRINSLGANCRKWRFFSGEESSGGIRVFLHRGKAHYISPTIFVPVVRPQLWMKEALIVEPIDGGQDRRIYRASTREWTRLRTFIRKRVPDPGDAEDILQEVFYELIVAYRLMEPIEQVGAWLFRVARNRITDFFRQKRPEALSEPIGVAETGDLLLLEDLLPSREAGPDAAYARGVLLE